MIQGDGDFANQALAEGWPGNGTAVSPYIIEGFDINCTGTGVPCIEISHTAVYFIIRGCNLLGGTFSTIGLDEVSNGYLFNNTCISQGRGIAVFNSTLVTVANCNCSSTGPDIGVAYSTQVTLFNNTCYGELGYADWSNIYLVESTQNTVVNNTCFSPIDNIELYIARNNTVANNTLYGGGFRFREFGPLAEHRQALVTGNTVNGKPLIFWQDQVGGTLPKDFGQAILVNCSQTSIQDTTVSGAGAGVVLVYCNETTLVSVRCEDNEEGLIVYAGGFNMVFTCQFILNWNGSGIGASIVNSSYNVFADNTFLYNAYGILLAGTHNGLLNNTFMASTTCGIIAESASYNTINMSWIVDNAYGLYFSPSNSNGNLIQDNVFSNYQVNVEDHSSGYNTYDQNYWSDFGLGPDEDQDGICEVPHYIVGTGNNWDWRPVLVMRGYPVIWLETPQDHFFLNGLSIYYDLDATATPPGISQWRLLSGATFFFIDQWGTLTNLAPLGAGSYWVEVWVSDWMGNAITAGFNIIVYGIGMNDDPILALLIGTAAAVLIGTFVSIVGIAILRQRRTTGPPAVEPFYDKRPPVDQWNARCPLCGSRLFGDEGFCPGCGTRVTRTRGR